ncbi:MAG: sensor histidine kinase [Bacteriovoracaceae bacterium]
MELKTRQWFYSLTLLWVMMLLGLGSWWLYLVFKLHDIVSKIDIELVEGQSKFLNMLKWEGSFFFIFLVLLGASLFYMYFRDMKKSKAMQAFFASLSHELKTPLASMRLQAEVIKDLIDDETHSHEQLSQLTQRLVEDTYKLEGELEKSLQLSRIEQGGSLTLHQVSLERFLKKHQQKFNLPLELHLAPDASEVLADELALNIILRNLFENTLRHNKKASRVSITTLKNHQQVELIYDDFGDKFKGQHGRLGELFYKFESTKGTGVGLYLIKNLMLKMQGSLEIQNEERLRFKLIFKAGENDV